MTTNPGGFWSAMIAAVTLLLGASVARGQQPAAGPAATGVRSLSEFGPLKTPDEIKAAYAKAKAEMTDGGVLLVPPGTAAIYSEENTSQISPRTPAPPAETKQWKKAGPGITVVEINPDGTVVKGPQVQGVTIERTLRMPLTESLAHWSTDAALTIRNKLVHGSQSYLDWTSEPIVPGNDAKVYVHTIRGLRVGAFVNIIGKGVTRACIKSLGFDAEKKKHFFTADVSAAHPARAVVQNKTNDGVVYMTQEGNADNQTYDIMLNRFQYALGDCYMYFARYKYMSNIHSSGGDENGNVFACYTENLTNSFTGVVDSVDWKGQALKFSGPKNAETLGNSRAIVNLNPSKAITKGKVLIVPAESYWDTIDTGKYPFEGKTYPTTVTKGIGLRMGGLIRGDKDCPWDESIVGRWFGVTEPTELIHGEGPADRIRWYQIDGLTVNADGTKDITIQRFWWGAKTMQSPMLYREDNGTWDGHVRPLPYVIVPGTYVTDVARAVPGKGAQIDNVLGLAPYRDMNTKFDFEKGDQIEQAVGPDPFKPTPIRIWMEDGVPSAFPAPAIDLSNESRGGHVTQRYAGIWMRGGHKTLEDTAKAADGRPGWDNGFVFESAMNVGLNLQGDFANAAILFQQPNREQPIKWHYGTREQGKPFTTATLTVTRDNGDLSFQGGDARFSGAVVAKGLSGGDTPAKNLRGKGVAVKAGASEATIQFPAAEADGDYAVFLELTWLTNRAVTRRTAEGFTVTFDKPAPADAKLDWMIVR